MWITPQCFSWKVVWNGNTEVEPGSITGLILSTSTVRGSPQVELMCVCSIWLALLHLVKVPCKPETSLSNRCFGRGHCSYCDHEASHWRTRKFGYHGSVTHPYKRLTNLSLMLADLNRSWNLWWFLQTSQCIFLVCVPQRYPSQKKGKHNLLQPFRHSHHQH